MAAAEVGVGHRPAAGRLDLEQLERAVLPHARAAHAQEGAVGPRQARPDVRVQGADDALLLLGRGAGVQRPVGGGELLGVGGAGLVLLAPRRTLVERPEQQVGAERPPAGPRAWRSRPAR